MAQPLEAAVDPRALLRDQTISARRRGHQFYLAITLFLIATVITGFWPSYFGTLLAGGVTRPPVMHMHGAVFTGWMALLLLQVGLAATGRVRIHRQVGRVGIGYGALVFVMGCIVTIAAPVMHVQAGEWTVDAAAAFLILPIGDMILFAGFFGTAIAFRHTPDIHKRLILAATVALAFDAVARHAPRGAERGARDCRQPPPADWRQRCRVAAILFGTRETASRCLAGLRGFAGTRDSDLRPGPRRNRACNPSRSTRFR